MRRICRNSSLPSLHIRSQCCIAAARQDDHRFKGYQSSKRPERPQELKYFIHQRRITQYPIRRRPLSKRIANQSRKEKLPWRTLRSSHLLQRFENTKFLQKVQVDQIKSSACPVESDESAVFLESIYQSSNAITNDIDPELLL